MPADRERHPPLPPDIDGFDLAALTPDPLGDAINDGLEGIWLQIRPDNVHEIVAVQRTPPHPASKHSPSKKIPPGAPRARRLKHQTTTRGELGLKPRTGGAGGPCVPPHIPTHWAT